MTCWIQRNLLNLFSVVLSTTITEIEKMAGTGLELEHLFIIYRRVRREEPIDQLKEQVNGKVRVTNISRILRKIAEFVEKS